VPETMTTTWRSAFDTVKKNYELTDDALGVFAINLRFNLDDFQSIAGESITGGGDDKKCDVIYIDKEREVAVIAQCYMSSKAREAAPSNKASDLNTAITWLLTVDIDSLPDSIKGRADELRAAVRAGEVKQLYIWYVHNLPGSTNVKTELAAVERAARTALSRISSGADINIFAEEICTNELERLYVQAERTVIVTDEFEIVVTGAVEVVEDDWRSIVTAVPGKWLSALYKKHRTNLFSANLRGYLGSRDSDSNINNGIKTTAEEEPDNFYVYNNGITALVLDYNIGKRTKSGIRIKINGISIVNGAQTTGSIGSLSESPSDDILVLIRFVKANREAIVENVVRYNNSQNKLQAADFRSTDQIQDRLRTEFSKIPDAEYEGGRRGGASDAIKRSKYTLPSYTVGQSLSAFHGDPVTAYDKKSELWTNEKNYRRIFTDRTTGRHIVFCYSLLSAITKRRLDLTQQKKKDESALTDVEKRNLAFLDKKGAVYLLVHVVAQCMETILSASISNKFDLHFSRNVSPAQAEDLWIPIVDMMLPLSGQLDGAFSRNRISQETVMNTPSVSNFVGIVASLSAIHKGTFERFAKNVRNGS